MVRLTSTICPLLVAFVLTFCDAGHLSAQASKEDLAPVSGDAQKIVFCRPNNMVSALSYIAEQKGFFTEQNLNVTFETATNAKICQDLVIAGKADFFNGGEGPFTYLASAKNPLVVVAFIQKNPEIAVFARRNRGITSLEDIKGKRVGYLPATVSYFYLVRLLQNLNLKMTDVALIPMQPPTMTQALTAGSIDAFIMWEPWGSTAMKELGQNGVKLEDPSMYRYHALLVTTDELRQKRPEVIKKVLRAEMKAEEFAALHATEAIALLAKATLSDPSVLEKNWPQFENRIHLDNETIKLLEENFGWLQRQDKDFSNSPMPDFRSYVDPSFLREVAPERVADDF